MFHLCWSQTRSWAPPVWAASPASRWLYSNWLIHIFMIKHTSVVLVQNRFRTIIRSSISIWNLVSLCHQLDWDQEEDTTTHLHLTSSSSQVEQCLFLYTGLSHQTSLHSVTFASPSHYKILCFHLCQCFLYAQIENVCKIQRMEKGETWKI